MNLELDYMSMGDGYDINGPVIIDDGRWYLVSISIGGLGRFRSVGGSNSNNRYDIEARGQLKIIGVDII